MIGKIIGALVVLGIVGYFMVSLGSKAKEAPQSAAVSKLQNEIQQQRQQLDNIEGSLTVQQPVAPAPENAEDAESDAADTQE
ncbi:MAG TPA: hypothetical protein PLX33_05105 [Alphaproteobacteria bacterium]|nr:hypothetical protein [Alphaproteobacteria bacterium]